MIQHSSSSGSFSIYTNPDVVRVELGGAVKLVVAIAAGVVRGLDFRTNALGAMIRAALAMIVLGFGRSGRGADE
jgi:glycerol-3-phosphate dehydrogenase (NAD(P)+)